LLVNQRGSPFTVLSSQLAAATGKGEQRTVNS
jgi:hypothetical protein